MGRYSRLGGEVTLDAVQGVVFRAVDIRMELLGDAWYVPPDGAWKVAGRAGVIREGRDFIAEVTALVTRWTPGASLRVHRTLAEGTTATASLSFSAYSAQPASPPDELGPIPARWVPPELALYGTQAWPVQGVPGLRRRLRDELVLAVEVGGTTLGGVPDTSPPGLPTSEESRTS